MFFLTSTWTKTCPAPQVESFKWQKHSFRCFQNKTTLKYNLFVSKTLLNMMCTLKVSNVSECYVQSAHDWKNNKWMISKVAFYIDLRSTTNRCSQLWSQKCQCTFLKVNGKWRVTHIRDHECTASISAAAPVNVQRPGTNNHKQPLLSLQTPTQSPFNLYIPIRVFYLCKHKNK